MENEEKNSNPGMGKTLLTVLLTLLVVAVGYLFYDKFVEEVVEEEDATEEQEENDEAEESASDDDSDDEEGEEEEDEDEVVEEEEANEESEEDSSDDAPTVDVDWLREQFANDDQFDRFLDDVDLGVTPSGPDAGSGEEDASSSAVDVDFLREQFNSSGYGMVDTDFNFAVPNTPVSSEEDEENPLEDFDWEGFWGNVGS